MVEPDNIENWIKVSNLGSGAFGVVTLWKNKDTDEFIAIKRCKANVTEKVRNRWEKEIQLIENSRNRNIVSYKKLPLILDNVLSKFSSLPLLSMEYCSGGNLRNVLHNMENNFGLEEKHVKYVVLDISNAISYLHDFNVVHRDIKPENIVLQQCNNRKENIIYKLIDMGYAKGIDSIGQSVVGTLPYLAPEILTGQKYNSSVDYWSFGIVVYEVICGQHPFLPTLPVPKRLQCIQNKQGDDIAIELMNDEPGFKYSKEIFKENKINKCLKENFELLLRGCFQYDSMNRNQNTFKDVKKILSKHIVTVFCVYTCEFFHYEYEDSTLITTLKTWISRDTKLNGDEQILLTENNCTNVFKDAALISQHKQGENDICFILFKRNEFTIANINVPEILTKLIRDNNVNENWSKAKKYYMHAAYFTYSLDNIITSLRQGCAFLTKYFKNLFMQELKKFNILDLGIKKLVNYCECLNNIESKIDLKQVNLNNLHLITLNKQHKLLHECKKLVTYYEKSVKKHKLFQNEWPIYCQYVAELTKTFNEAVQMNVYNKILDISRRDCGMQNLKCSEIRNNILSAIRVMQGLLKDEVFAGFVKKGWKIEKHHGIIMDMIAQYENACDRITSNLLDIHVHKLNLMSRDVKTRPLACAVFDCTENSKAITLQETNQQLRIGLEQSLENYRNSVQGYYTYIQDINLYGQ